MKLLIIGLLSFISQSVFSANYPFPQNVKYTYGIKPSNAKHSDALNSYNYFKNLYVVDDGAGRKRVLFQDASNSTVSEGIAYGMLLAVYANDQTTFDGLWKYYKYHMNGNGVMNWKINGSGAAIGTGGATDAEEDAAMALIVADNQWGSGGAINYLSDGIILINNIMAHEVETPSYILKPGDAWGGAYKTNPSYFAPAYYRVYYQVTGDAQWLNVIDKCYEILSLNTNATTGLASDWCNSSGNALSTDYFYDATRYPWRMATDYLWYGSQEAKDYCVKIANFIKGKGGSSSVGDRYALNGTQHGYSHNNAFVGTFALASMVDASFQSQLNASYTDNVNTYPDGYFNQMLQSISLFMLTGNFYRMPLPVCQTPDLGPDLSLCTSSSYTLNTGLSTTNRTFLWSTGETTPTITVNAKGTYIVQADSFGCIKKDTIQLLGLGIDLGADRDIKLGEPYILDAGTSGSGVTYTWNTSDVTQTIIIDSAGFYSVRVDSSGCSDRDSVLLSYEETDQVEVYPNPTQENVKILLLDAYAESAEVEIFSSKGQQIAKLNFIVERGTPLIIDLSPFSEGTYYLRIKTTKSVKVMKVYRE